MGTSSVALATTPLSVPAAEIVDNNDYFSTLRKIPNDAVMVVRTYVQDFAEKNHLLDNKEEYTDTEIRFAIAKAFSDLNSIPPISITIAGAEQRVPINFLLIWSSMNLMEMSIFRRLRNDLQYTDSGVTVDTEKHQKYMALLDSMRSYYFNIVSKYKQSINLEGVTGVLPSAYTFQWFQFY